MEKSPRKDNAEGKTVTLAQASWRAYKAEFSSSFVPTFAFAMLSICVLAVGLWKSWTLYFALPLIELPLFFALQITISGARQGHPFSSKGFFSYFGMYFRSPYYGVYRVIGNVLWAFLWSILIAFLFNLFYVSFAYAHSAVFASGFQKLYQASINLDDGAYAKVLSDNGEVALWYVLSEVVETGGWFLISVFKISVWTLNSYVRASMKRSRFAPRAANRIFMGGYRENRKVILTELLRATWVGIVLLLLGFALGCVAGYFLSEYIDIVASGIAGSFLLTIFFVPYFLIVVELLADRFEVSFAKFSVRFAEDALHQLQANRELDEAQAKDIQKLIDEAKETNRGKPEGNSAETPKKEKDGSQNEDAADDDAESDDY
ncbi:MAG: hypothetical protein LKK13_00215 [Bacilli bacterium]|jgi:hypothetical protein|nr:hypothetical protein [Bacilli bacterium]